MKIRSATAAASFGRGRSDVRCDADDAVAAKGDELAAHGVLAAVEEEVVAALLAEGRDAAVVARRLRGGGLS